MPSLEACIKQVTLFDLIVKLNTKTCYCSMNKTLAVCVGSVYSALLHSRVLNHIDFPFTRGDLDSKLIWIVLCV